MGKDADLLIKINADGSNADKAFSNLQSRTENLKTGLASVAKASAVAFAGVTAGLGWALKSAMDVEQAEIRLTNSLKVTGSYTDELKGKMIAAAEAMTKFSKFENEDIMDSMAALTRRTGDYTIALKYEQTIIDLATEKQLDLETATRMVGMAYNGNTMMLQKQGVMLTKNVSGVQALEEISKQFAGSSKKWSESTLGAYTLMKKAVGDLGESIGLYLLPKATEMFVKAKGLVNVVTEWNEKTHGLIGTIGMKAAAITGLVAGVGFLIPAIITAKNNFMLFNAVMSANPAIAVTLAVAGLTLGLTELGVAAADNYSKEQGAQALTKNMITTTEEQIRQKKTTLSLMKVGTAEYDKEAKELITLRQKLIGLTASEKQHADAKIANIKKVADAKEDAAKRAGADSAAEEAAAEAAANASKTGDTDVLTSATSAANALVGLQSSKSRTMFEIGKAAAMATIPLDTAKSASDIYAGFATIPVVGPALGIAGAAAAIAFGATRLAEASSAKFNPAGAAEGIFDFRASGNNENLVTTIGQGETVIPKNMTEAIKSGEMALSGRGGPASQPLIININGDTIGIDSNDLMDKLTKKIRAGIQSGLIPVGRLSGATTG